MTLANRVVVISGAAGGLGRVVTPYMADQGANLVLLGRTQERLTNLADELGLAGDNHLTLALDLVDPVAVESAANAAIQKFGKIDILFNGAGIAHRQPSVEMPIEDWEKVMDVNVRGTLLCSRAVAGEMIKQGIGGNIITVGSVRGFQAHEGGYSAYGTSKAAVHYLTKQLAFEWAKYKIRVNCIAPCIFWSPLTEPILSDEASYKDYVARIPIGRAAEPEDFVGVTIFLASDASEMVTGHVLSVDGGTVGG